ncbi:MAG: outer membrane protein transport protein [Pseudomonadota bacterium]
MTNYRRLAALAAVPVALTLGGQEAKAGAFQLNERSTKALGASLAGSVSAASDVTFITFNPAALATVENVAMGGSLSLVSPISNAEIVTGPAAGLTDDADSARAVPSSAAALRVTDELVIGFGVYAPFGLVTKYDSSFPAAGDAVTSELDAVSFSPMISYEPIEGLSFGAAFNVLAIDARLTNAVIVLDGYNVEYGFSLGALWEPIDGTQIGIAYHAGYDAELEGIHENAIIGLAADDLIAKASLPSTFQVGITQAITDDLRVMGEFRWIDWSAFDTIDVITPSFSFAPPLDNFSDVQNYEDAFFGAIGAEYDINDQFTIRGGVAYDQTPTTDEFRTPRVPDEDRVWISAGVSFSMNEHMTMDASYSYLHALSDPEVTIRSGPAAGSLIEYEGGAHIFSLGGEIRF